MGNTRRKNRETGTQGDEHKEPSPDPSGMLSGINAERFEGSQEDNDGDPPMPRRYLMANRSTRSHAPREQFGNSNDQRAGIAPTQLRARAKMHFSSPLPLISPHLAMVLA